MMIRGWKEYSASKQLADRLRRRLRTYEEKEEEIEGLGFRV